MRRRLMLLTKLSATLMLLLPLAAAFALVTPIAYVPDDGSNVGTDADPEISVHVSGSGSLASSHDLVVNGTPVTASWAYDIIPAHWEGEGCDAFWVPPAPDPTKGTLSYQPTALPDGACEVIATIRESVGATTALDWSFDVGPIPPTISEFTPAAETRVTTGTPVISANIGDNGGVLPSSAATMTLDGELVAASFESGLISFTPASPLAPDAWHTISVTATDTDDVPDATTKTWRFYYFASMGELPDVSAGERCEWCHVGYPEAGHAMDDCDACHNPVSSPLGHNGLPPEAYQLESYPPGTAHAPSDLNEYPGDCDSCHTSGNYPAIPMHDAEPWYYHDSTSTICRECHSGALLSEHYGGTSGGESFDCWSCHTSTDTTVTAAIAARDTDCEACHVPHGDVSHEPTTTAADTPCAACHESDLVPEHANGLEVPEDETCVVCHPLEESDTLACISCHTIDHTDAESSHHGATSTTLIGITCDQCHVSYEQIGDPQVEYPLQGSQAQVCGACHDLVDSVAAEDEIIIGDGGIHFPGPARPQLRVVSSLAGTEGLSFASERKGVASLSAAEYKDMAVGDVNGDGREDIVVTLQRHALGQPLPRLALALQSPEGQIGEALLVDTWISRDVSGVAIGDVDDDGTNEVVVRETDPERVTVLEWQDDALRATVNGGAAAGGSGGGRIAIGDVDDDGKAEIVSVNHDSDSFSIYELDSDALVCTETVASDGDGPWGVAIGDVGPSPGAEIVVANQHSQTARVFGLDPSGLHSVEKSIGTYSVRDVAIGDVLAVQDGLEIVTLEASGWHYPTETFGAHVLVYDGTSAGYRAWVDTGGRTFSQPDGDYHHFPRLAVGDFDRSGSHDVAVSSVLREYLQPFRGRTTILTDDLQRLTHFEGPYGYGMMAVGDVGRPAPNGHSAESSAGALCTECHNIHRSTTLVSGDADPGSCLSCHTAQQPLPSPEWIEITDEDYESGDFGDDWHQGAIPYSPWSVIQPGLNGSDYGVRSPNNSLPSSLSRVFDKHDVTRARITYRTLVEQSDGSSAGEAHGTCDLYQVSERGVSEDRPMTFQLEGGDFLVNGQTVAQYQGNVEYLIEIDVDVSMWRVHGVSINGTVYDNEGQGWGLRGAPEFVNAVSFTAGGLYPWSDNAIRIDEIGLEVQRQSDVGVGGAAPVGDELSAEMIERPWPQEPIPIGGSYHPVLGSGVGSSYPAGSFAPGWSEESTVTCGDCHEMGAMQDEQVRHGSSYGYSLRKPYSDAAYTDPDMLCFQCHSHDFYVGGPRQASHAWVKSSSSVAHSTHSAWAQSCSECHVGHGGTGMPGLLRPELLAYRTSTNAWHCSAGCHTFGYGAR